jgi:hypothetical protein
MINVIELSSYETPKATIDPRKGFVAYGEDNNYYEFLIETYLHSATNNASIKSISDLIFGRGLSILEKEEDSPEVEAIKEIISDKDLRKIILDRKMLGQSAAQVIYTGRGKNRKVKSIKHFPIHTLRPEKASMTGEIMNYYYHPDWKNYKNTDKLKKIPTFGNSTEAIELFIVRQYIPNHTYFSPVDYSGALGYAELEAEISNYHLNDIHHGFSGSKIINFNNGQPSEEARRMITEDVKRKLTGARGEKVIVAFNESKDNKTTVEDLPLNDAPAHYEYLASEAASKIMVGHRVTSPMLLGIRDGSKGLGNNADEIMTASQLFHSTVIKNFQDEICEFLKEVLLLNGINEEIYFVTTQPVEFMEDDANEKEDNAEKEERTGVKGKNYDDSKDSKKKEETKLSVETFDASEQVEWLKHLTKVGEDDLEGEEYELVEAELATENESDNIEEDLNKAVKLSAMQGSMMDSKMFKVRYAYVHRSGKKSASSKKSSRAFCRTLEGTNKVYRKEDILKMKGMNSELGHNKQPYSIWLHAGGVNCYHGWERRIYKKRIKTDGTPYGGAGLNGTRKVSVNDAKKAGFKSKPQSKRVSEANIDRADKGHHPNYIKSNK